MTMKIMERINLKITRPYHNVCAMDSREVDFVDIIFGFLVRFAKYLDIYLNMGILVIDIHKNGVCFYQESGMLI